MLQNTVNIDALCIYLSNLVIDNWEEAKKYFAYPFQFCVTQKAQEVPNSHTDIALSQAINGLDAEFRKTLPDVPTIKNHLDVIATNV